MELYLESTDFVIRILLVYEGEEEVEEDVW